MYFDLSKKTKYAMMALLELALRGPTHPLNARKLSFEKDLPVRFTEVILNELKQGGFVFSQRGKAGGYVLSRPAAEITVAQVLNFLEPRCVEQSGAFELSLSGQFAVNFLLQGANTALAKIFEQCTLDDLVRTEMDYRQSFETNYVI